jgi:hypothetical protein
MNILQTKIEIIQYQTLMYNSHTYTRDKNKWNMTYTIPNLHKSRLVYILNVRSSTFGRYPLAKTGS